MGYEWDIPSGKLSHNYGKPQFLMGKLTISMAMFNSYVKLPESTKGIAMVAMVPMVLIIVTAPRHQYVLITVDGRQALVTMMIDRSNPVSVVFLVKGKAYGKQYHTIPVFLANELYRGVLQWSLKPRIFLVNITHTIQTHPNTHTNTLHYIYI